MQTSSCTEYLDLAMALSLSVSLFDCTAPGATTTPLWPQQGLEKLQKQKKKTTARTFETFPKQLAITKKSCGESKTYRQWVGLTPVQFTNVLEWATTTHTHTHTCSRYIIVFVHVFFLVF